MSQEQDGLFPAGHIIGVFGVKGQVKIYSHTSPRENIVNYSPWVIKHAGTTTSHKVSGGRQGKNVIVWLEGIDSRELAMQLAGAEIFLHRSQLPSLDEGEFYWSQLEGLEVMNTNGEKLGSIDHMLETGANDVMVVQGGDRERLIPYVMDEVVKRVDLEQSQVIVDWDADF
jgi:16S rRNA processing protein RimM